MFRRISAALVAALATAAVRGAAAQTPGVDRSCPQAPGALPTIPTPSQAGAYFQTQIVRDACQKAIDIFQLMAPQLGTSVAGGNAVLGRGGAFGGVGRFSIGLRGNVVQGALPRLDNVALSTAGPQRTPIPTKSQLVGLPTAEVSLGLFPGVPIGLTNVGGVDAIVSGFYVPDFESDGVALRTIGGGLKLGYGARLGLLQETALVPGVSLTYLRRDLPTLSVTARVQASGGAQTADTVRVTGLNTRTGAWRLVASKSVGFVAFAAGAGRDTYNSRASVSAFVAPRAGVAGVVPYTTPAFDGTIASTSQKLTRANYFADLQFNLALVKLVLEVGQVSGGTVRATYNTFGSHTAGERYTYGSLGVRIGS